MDTKKASELAQILSLPFAAYCAYGVWVSHQAIENQASQGTGAPTVTVMARFFSSTWVLVAFGAFVALVLLSAVLLALSRWQPKGARTQTQKPSDRPYPTVMIFRHEEARQKNQLTYHQITDRFTQAGWRVEGSTTNLPQHANGIRILGGSSFEREMAKWGLDGLGVQWQQDYAGDPPQTLQIVVGLYDAPPRNQAVVESVRLTQMKRILTEASEYISAMPSGLGNTSDAARLSLMVLETIPELLNRSMVVPPTADYDTFMKAEHDRRGNNFDASVAAATFLKRLSANLAERDIEPTFLIPLSFNQFRETDKWPPNVAT